MVTIRFFSYDFSWRSILKPIEFGYVLLKKNQVFWLCFSPKIGKENFFWKFLGKEQVSSEGSCRAGSAEGQKPVLTKDFIWKSVRKPMEFG